MLPAAPVQRTGAIRVVTSSVLDCQGAGLSGGAFSGPPETEHNSADRASVGSGLSELTRQLPSHPERACGRRGLTLPAMVRATPLE